MLDSDGLISNVRTKFSLDGDLTKQGADTLLFELVLTFFWEGQCLFRLLCWKLPDLTMDQIGQRAKELSEKPTPEVLTQLYHLHPAKEPLEFLVLLHCWRDEISQELNARVKRYSVGKRLVAYLAGKEMETLNDSWLLSLLKALEVEKIKVRSYRQHHLDVQDLWVAAVNKAVERHNEQSDSINVAIGLPIFNLPDNFLGLPCEPDQLRGRFTASMTRTITESIKFFLPLLRGQLEDLPEAVRQNRRDLFHKLDGRRDILEGKENFPKHGPESVRADWDFVEAAADGRRKDINAETAGVILTPEESLGEREQGARTYHFVSNRWGEKGRKYLDTLLATHGNVTEASAAAGISRVTGHKWRTEIQILLSKKNLTK